MSETGGMNECDLSFPLLFLYTGSNVSLSLYCSFICTSKESRADSYNQLKAERDRTEKMDFFFLVIFYKLKKKFQKETRI